MPVLFFNDHEYILVTTANSLTVLPVRSSTTAVLSLATIVSPLVTITPSVTFVSVLINVTTDSFLLRLVTNFDYFTFFAIRIGFHTLRPSILSKQEVVLCAVILLYVLLLLSYALIVGKVTDLQTAI